MDHPSFFGVRVIIGLIFQFVMKTIVRSGYGRAPKPLMVGLNDGGKASRDRVLMKDGVK